ncbi:MAG: sulfate adenylyltransferase, partial [Deltaproteobacteria bacterium]|nr:sulfate adenylyltransferase [Deltaproteobacteria bacterium]
MSQTISPHGGTLINRMVSAEEKSALEAQLADLPKVILNERQLSDLDMIACGAMSPLEGFMGKADYESVVSKMRLASGLPWSLPITLAVSRDLAEKLKIGTKLALADESNQVLAVLDLTEKFNYDKKQEAKEVYGTEEEAHPGVAALYAQGEVLLAGPVRVIKRLSYDSFNERRQDPEELRKIFEERGWKTVVGFQTRNPIHRAHEYLQKCALEMVDGLLIHPLMGATKSDDIPGDVRMQCYETLLEKYFPADRTHLSVFPAAMRYAGPREAIFHALVRKNYGCTHFIVGRDHAGVG